MFLLKKRPILAKKSQNQEFFMKTLSISSDKPVSYSKQDSFFLPLCASCLLAICAQICIPFSPVPLTGQTVAVMLIAARLGKRQALLAILFYLIEGSLGLPVFAEGMGGVHVLFGKTGGYLLGYGFQIACIGVLREKKKIPLFFSFFIPSLLQLFLGACWLSYFVSFQSALNLGFYPFIAIEALKGLFVIALLSYFKKP